LLKHAAVLLKKPQKKHQRLNFTSMLTNAHFTMRCAFFIGTIAL
jgi:hypothetical protein